jgi:sodium pump decarboxylase gamma subunit
MFQDTVTDTILLSLIDMTVVFAVLAFLMAVVYVTAFFAKSKKPAPEPKADEPSPAAPEDELEIVAVQAAALAAQQDQDHSVLQPPVDQPGSRWRRPPMRSGKKPSWYR